MPLKSVIFSYIHVPFQFYPDLPLVRCSGNRQAEAMTEVYPSHSVVPSHFVVQMLKQRPGLQRQQDESLSHNWDEPVVSMSRLREELLAVFHFFHCEANQEHDYQEMIHRHASSCHFVCQESKMRTLYHRDALPLM